MKNIEVFVFSYNRGLFLENCVNSIIRNVPGSNISIIDDKSDDEKTCNYLNSLNNSIRVYNPGNNVCHRWGGFYNNIRWMQAELACSDWVIAVEDDMQFIRPLTHDDEAKINKFFKLNPSAYCLDITFLMEQHYSENQSCLSFDSDSNAYFFDEKAKSWRGTIHMNSCVALNIKKIRESGFIFGNDRNANRANVERLFSPMGVYYAPLMMYLPRPNSTKGKYRSLTRKVAERYRRYGFHPYHDLENGKLIQFLQRDPEVLPYASDWIETKTGLPGSLFHYNDVFYKQKWWSRIDKVEVLLLKKLGLV